MWIVLISLYLWAPHCAASSSPPSPVSVTFSSLNLRNTVQWLPGNGTAADTHFTVQYAIYGDSVVDSRGRRGHWRAVQQCTDIRRSWCDLSSETWDVEHRYFARVRAVSRRASSKWALTKRFDPKSDITFGPPLVSVETKDNSAIITLMGPMRYQPYNQTPVVSMATLYPQMMYNLSIHNKGRGQMNHFTVVSSQYKHRLMEYDTEYCFAAKAKFFSMPVWCQSSKWHCITTPPDPAIGQLQKVVVGIAVSSVCLCLLVVAGYLLYQYVMGIGQKSPYILNMPSYNLPPLTFPPETPNIILITVKQGAFATDPPPGYTPQGFDTPPEPEDPWSDVSSEYGFVGAAPRNDVRRGGQEKRENRRDGGEDGNMQTETSTVTQSRARSPVNPGSPTPSETPLLSGKVDGGVEEGGERVSLLPAYASQDTDMLTSGDDQSDFLPDDYGVLRLATANKIEIGDDGEQEEEDEEEEEEERRILIDWDPITGRLILPEMKKEFTKELSLDRSTQGEREGERRLGGEEGEEEEEVKATRGKLTLEDVFVRQASEEEAQRQLERGGETDDIFAKWNLVISMDQ